LPFGDTEIASPTVAGIHAPHASFGDSASQRARVLPPDSTAAIARPFATVKPVMRVPISAASLSMMPPDGSTTTRIWSARSASAPLAITETSTYGGSTGSVTWARVRPSPSRPATIRPPTSSSTTAM
jgi:hypothetical protein